MAEKAEDKLVGTITHYFKNISVAVIELHGTLKEGDEIEIRKGDGSSFKQKVSSMQIEHNKVEEAKKGQAIGMKVKEPVHENAKVYKV